MGANQSCVRGAGARHRCESPQRQIPEKAGAQVRRRIELLEELCTQSEPGRRAEVLQQLAGGHNSNAVGSSAAFSTATPPEFNAGRLIAAGSYGRVYEGTYAGQPAALKLLLLDEETAHAILNEVRLCLKLNHKNLVQLLDCAVVAVGNSPDTPRCLVPGSPGAAFAGHEILPVYGSSISSALASTPCLFNHPPAGPGPADPSSVPAALQSSSAAASWQNAATPSADGPACHDGALPALGPSLGLGKFEVWIAMELCDGGTLAEQLLRGFHCLPGTTQVDMEHLLQVSLDIAHALAYMHRENVCHGDLKTENVLLKTLPPAPPDLQRVCCFCGSSTCSDDCSWLSPLCSSSQTNNSSTPRCRSCGGSESCWSCYSRAMGCMEAGGGFSSPDTLSDSSSSISGHGGDRRSRFGCFKGSGLLSGLCCIGSPMSCATDEDGFVDDERIGLSGCLACGCGVMSLEPSMHSAACEGAETAEAEEFQSALEQCQQQQPAAAGGLAAVSTADGLQPPVFTPSQSQFAAAGAAGSIGSMVGTDEAVNLYSSVLPLGFPHPILEGQEQKQRSSLQQPVLSGKDAHSLPAQQASSAAFEDVPEEEHVAPLSLYTQARQRRLSRCLPHGLVPALAAAAAAAVAGTGDLHIGRTSAESTSSSTPSSSEDDGGMGHSILGPHRAAAVQQGLQRQGSFEGSVAPLAAASLCDAGLELPAAAAACSISATGGRSAQRQGAVRRRSSWHEAAAGPSAAAGVHLDVYAHSMLLPPVSRRTRRHSYCYGTTASYGGAVLGIAAKAPQWGMRLQPIPPSSISATEAATAIAAAAEAVRLDSSRAPEQRSHRQRRMSWDDRMLRAPSPTRSTLGGLLGYALPGLARLGSDGAAGAGPLQQPAEAAAAAGAGRPHGRRTRRHSWAGYLHPDMAAAAAAAASLRTGEQLDRQQALFKLHGGGDCASFSMAGRAPCASTRGGRRARRHSWAGFGLEQSMPLGPAKASGLRALSSCFAAGDVGSSHASAGRSHLSLHISPPRQLFAHLSGCCADGCWRAADAPSEPDSSRHALLGDGPSSSLLGAEGAPDCLLLPDVNDEGAGAPGCFGRWCSSCNSSSATSSAGIGGHRSSRRYSWCCGAGSEAELFAVLNREHSSSKLLSGMEPLSVPLLDPQPVQRRGRNRRCSFDSYSYRARPSFNWGRKAASLEAHVSTPSSWLSQQLSGTSAAANSRQSPLLRSSSDGSARAEQVSSTAVAATPRRDSMSAAQPLPTELLPGSAVGAVQLSSCSSSPACCTPLAPVRHQAPLSPHPVDTRMGQQCDQSLSGPNAVGGLLSPLKPARMRGALTLQPPPLPAVPTVQQQHVAWPQCEVQQQLAASSQTGRLRGEGSSCAAAWPPAAPGSAAAYVLPAGPDGHMPLPDVHQGAGAAASLPATSAAGAPAAAIADLSSQEPFTGSFTLVSSSSRVAGLRPDACEGATGSKALGGRGRRWSTGVAAQELLLRKHLLDTHVGSPPRDAAAAASGSAAGLEATSAGARQHAAAAQVACVSRGTWSVSVADTEGPEPPVAKRSNGSSPSSCSQHRGLASSTNTSVMINVLGMPRQPSAVVSQRRMSYDTATGVYQLVAHMDSEQMLALQAAQACGSIQQHASSQLQQQVPPGVLSARPAGVLAAAYQNLRVAVEDLEQTPPMYNTPGASPTAAGDVGLGDQLLQQQCKAQWQRLREALACKGYGGFEGDLEGLAGSSQQGAAAAAAAAAGVASQPLHVSGVPATLQHQVQVAHAVAPLPQPRYCAKVCDFGFSRCLRAGQSHCSTADAGTITHQAPEVLRHGHLSPAADVYAFGIILWELLVRDRPFKGLLEGDLVVGVCDHGMRPVFPPSCPASYVALAQQCWAEDPGQRPTSVQLVKRLNELLYEERRARLRAVAGTPRVGSTPTRPRRHSMPVSGYIRHRRRSRRMSVFLLPFTRQPVVPEDAPLEQQLDDVRVSASGNHGCPQPGAACALQARSSMEPAMLVPSVGSSPMNARVRGSSVHVARSSSSSSNIAHVQQVGRSASNVSASASNNSNVVSAGGLLISSSTLSRLKHASGTAAPVPAGSSAFTSGAQGVAEAPGAAEAPGGDGTEWFQSF